MSLLLCWLTAFFYLHIIDIHRAAATIAVIYGVYLDRVPTGKLTAGVQSSQMLIYIIQIRTIFCHFTNPSARSIKH
jgi:hypothetical protein